MEEEAWKVGKGARESEEALQENSGKGREGGRESREGRREVRGEKRQRKGAGVQKPGKCPGLAASLLDTQSKSTLPSQRMGTQSLLSECLRFPACS